MSKQFEDESSFFRAKDPHEQTTLDHSPVIGEGGAPQPGAGHSEANASVHDDETVPAVVEGGTAVEAGQQSVGNGEIPPPPEFGTEVPDYVTKEARRQVAAAFGPRQEQPPQ